VDSVGVFLWANRAQYAEVSFQTVAETDIADVGLPTMQEDNNEDGLSILSCSIWSVPNGFLPVLCLVLASVADDLSCFPSLI
jgi:hypothetical protein